MNRNVNCCYFEDTSSQQITNLISLFLNASELFIKQATEKGERSASGIACLFQCVPNINRYKIFHTVNLTFQKEN